ncbi:MAG: RHS repeat domain-containing protein [Nanoarchaeota archaeon]
MEYYAVDMKRAFIVLILVLIVSFAVLGYFMFKEKIFLSPSEDSLPISVYDEETGSLLQHSYPDGVIVRFAYDAEGKSSEERWVIGENMEFVITYFYDTEGKVIYETYPEGRIDYQYYEDGFLRKKTIQDKNTNMAYIFNKKGQIVAIDSANVKKYFSYSVKDNEVSVNEILVVKPENFVMSRYYLVSDDKISVYNPITESITIYDYDGASGKWSFKSSGSDVDNGGLFSCSNNECELKRKSVKSSIDFSSPNTVKQKFEIKSDDDSEDIVDEKTYNFNEEGISSVNIQNQGAKQVLLDYGQRIIGFGGEETIVNYEGENKVKVGAITATFDENGLVSRIEIDSTNPLIAALEESKESLNIKEIYNWIDYTYDEFGRLIKENYENKKSREYFYDEAGELIKMIDNGKAWYVLGNVIVDSTYKDANKPFISINEDSEALNFITFENPTTSSQIDEYYETETFVKSVYYLREGGNSERNGVAFLIHAEPAENQAGKIKISIQNYQNLKNPKIYSFEDSFLEDCIDADDSSTELNNIDSKGGEISIRGLKVIIPPDSFSDKTTISIKKMELSCGIEIKKDELPEPVLIVGKDEVDQDEDGTISIYELVSFVQVWIKGEVGIVELQEAIKEWIEG